jgi:hypothetical protein
MAMVAASPARVGDAVFAVELSGVADMRAGGGATGAGARQPDILGESAHGYNRRLPGTPSMEAERLNALEGSLADLADRVRQLRRYL